MPFVTSQNVNRAMCYFYGALVVLCSAARALIEIFQLQTDVNLWYDLRGGFYTFYLLGLPVAVIGGVYCFILFRYKFFPHLRYIHKVMVVVVVTYVTYFFLYTLLQMLQLWLAFYLPYDFFSVLVLLPLFYILFLYEEKPRNRIKRWIPITADVFVLTVAYLALGFMVAVGFRLLGHSDFLSLWFWRFLILFFLPLLSITFTFITYTLLIAHKLVIKIKQTYFID